jgi:hypothetical protein
VVIEAMKGDAGCVFVKTSCRSAKDTTRNEIPLSKLTSSVLHKIWTVFPRECTEEE